MSRIARLAGAILAETGGAHYLVGDLKEPCDWAAAGFAEPGELRPLEHPFVRHRAAGKVRSVPPVLEMDLEGEELASLLARRFLIERNGSVSDRLWRLVVSGGDPDAPPPAAVDGRWLARIPDGVWKIVREGVLRCL